MLENNLPADRQSQAGATGPGLGCAALYELVENAVQLVLRNTDAGVAETDHQRRPVFAIFTRSTAGQFGSGEMDLNTTLFGGELDGIGEQVVEDLGDPFRVTD